VRSCQSVNAAVAGSGAKTRRRMPTPTCGAALPAPGRKSTMKAAPLATRDRSRAPLRLRRRGELPDLPGFVRTWRRRPTALLHINQTRIVTEHRVPLITQAVASGKSLRIKGFAANRGETGGRSARRLPLAAGNCRASAASHAFMLRQAHGARNDPRRMRRVAVAAPRCRRRSADLSVSCVTSWRRGWDSNPRSLARGTTDFESAPFGRSGTSPSH
jgi:hypothetical protein